MQFNQHERPIGKQVVCQFLHDSTISGVNRWWVGYAGEDVPMLLSGKDSPAVREQVAAKVLELMTHQARFGE